MRFARALIVVGAVVVLGSLNYSIFAKERIIRKGETVYLKLRPVDPRSLMQGDYMDLQFELAETIWERRKKEGRDYAAMRLEEGQIKRAPIVLDGRRIATLAEKKAPGDLEFRYRVRNSVIWLGTNAMFFEEGTAQRYTKAEYGEFKLDRKTGEAVLVRLRDADLKPL